MIGRRGFITGLIAFVAAPAIVRAGSLMPVKAWDPLGPGDRAPYWASPADLFKLATNGERAFIPRWIAEEYVDNDVLRPFFR